MASRLRETPPFWKALLRGDTGRRRSAKRETEKVHDTSVASSL